MKADFKIKFLTLSLIFLILESGCAIQNGAQKKIPNVAQAGGKDSSTPPQSPVDYWEETALVQGSAKLHVKTLKAQYRDEIKRKFKVPELVEIKSDLSGSFTLYRAVNIEQASKVVFIQPKLFVFGTAQGGNVLKITSQDGQRVTLTIPVAFVDGLRNALSSYEGKGTVVLPDTLVIPKVDELKADLSKQLGGDVQLQALPPSLKELSLIHIRGSKNDRHRLIPTNSIESRAPLNEFFTVSFTSSREAVTDLIQNAIDTGLSVQILSRFRLEYRDPIAVYSLDLDPILTYKAIREQFVAVPFGSGGADPTLYLAHQLISPLQSLLTQSIGQTGANPAWVPYSQGVNALEDAYFDDVTGQNGCPSGQHCFRVKRESDVNFNGPIELMWTQQETLGASDMISSLTLVKGLDETFPIVVSNQRSIPMTSMIPTIEACLREGNNIPGCAGFSCEKFPANAYCRQGNTKAPVSQFQVFPGAKLKLSLSRVTEWRYELSGPREDTSVEQKKGTLKCADSQEIPGACAEYRTKCPVDLVDFCPQPKDDCDDEKDLFDDHCEDSLTNETDCGFLGWGQCTEKVKEKKHTCQKIKTGHFCNRYRTSCLSDRMEKVCPKEQVTECVTPARQCEQYTTEFYSKYTYSEPWVSPRHLDLNQGEGPEELWEGISIEFTSLKEDGSGYNRAVCPILAFPHWLDGHHSITILLANQSFDSCQPFNEWNQKEGRWPSIAILNQIQFKRLYQCGSLEWTHAVDYSSEFHTRDSMVYYCPATGERSSTPVHAQYQPIVDLEGTVSLLGRSISTISSQSENREGLK